MLRRRILIAAPLIAVLLGLWASVAVLHRMHDGRYDPYGLDNPLVGHKLPASTPPLDLKRAPLLVNFFASWCVPCREESPALNQLQARGITIYGVAYKDQRSKIGAFLAEGGNPYHNILWDDAGRLAIDWGVSGVPETYLIDANGVVQARWSGAISAEMVLVAMHAR